MLGGRHLPRVTFLGKLVGDHHCVPGPVLRNRKVLTQFLHQPTRAGSIIFLIIK